MRCKEWVYSGPALYERIVGHVCDRPALWRVAGDEEQLRSGKFFQVCGIHKKRFERQGYAVEFDAAEYRRRHSHRVPKGYGKEG